MGLSQVTSPVARFSYHTSSVPSSAVLLTRWLVPSPGVVVLLAAGAGRGESSGEVEEKAGLCRPVSFAMVLVLLRLYITHTIKLMRTIIPKAIPTKAPGGRGVGGEESAPGGVTVEAGVGVGVLDTLGDTEDVRGKAGSFEGVGVREGVPLGEGEKDWS